MPQGQDHLDDPGDAGGGLGVADVGLHRAEPERPSSGAVLPVGGEQGLGLDRVAEGGAGAVGLDRVDVGRVEPGGGQGGGDDPLLGGAVGGGQAVGGAVLVDRRARGSPRGRCGRCAGRPTAARAAPGRRPRRQPVPSAAAANDLHRPSAARPRWRPNSTKTRGRHHGDPAGQRQLASPRAQRLQARCMATREEEQAVSTVTAGPSRPRA